MLRRLIDRLLGMTGRAARPDLSRYDGTDGPKAGPRAELRAAKRPVLRSIPGGRPAKSETLQDAHMPKPTRRAG